MTDSNFYKITNGKDFTILERHNLLQDWGEISILKDIDEHYYIGMSVHPDRGHPYFKHWKIKKEHYETFKNPTEAGLKNLLSVQFFESTLFEVFLRKKENEEFLRQILDKSVLENIDSSAAKAWCNKNFLEKNDAELFQQPTFLGRFEMSGIIHACQFKTDDLLEVETLFLNPDKNKYEIKKYLLNLGTGEISNESLIDMKYSLKYFTFAKDYPIKAVYFGEKRRYKAKALKRKSESKNQQVVIIKNSQELYSYDYPTTAGLGRFWVFDDETSNLRFKNSVLFMFSQRDHLSKDNYFVLRFEIKRGEIVPRTKITTQNDTTVAFSPNGRMVYSIPKESGLRSNIIEVVQL